MDSWGTEQNTTTPTYKAPTQIGTDSDWQITSCDLWSNQALKQMELVGHGFIIQMVQKTTSSSHKNSPVTVSCPTIVITA